MGLHCTSTV